MTARSYDADHLVVYGKSVDFLTDARFRSAYMRGAATHAARLPGDFVECGVNTGIMALAVCDYVDLEAAGKSFWLFDTFNGIPEEQISEREAVLGRREENAAY